MIAAVVDIEKWKRSSLIEKTIPRFVFHGRSMTSSNYNLWTFRERLDIEIVGALYLIISHSRSEASN